MNTLRLEARNVQNEVEDFIDLRDDLSIEQVIRAGQVLRAKRAAELGDLLLADSIEIDLTTER